MEEQSNLDKRRVRCPKCNFRLKHRSHLNEHMISRHSQVRSYPCSVCDVAFKSIGNLNKHSNIHLQVLPYLCSYCGKRFSRKFSLLLHEKQRHSDDRPFQCSKCNAAFKNKTHLKQHLKMHAKLKVWGCPYCKERFYLKKELMYHKKSHSPFRCSFCKKSFKSKQAIRVHIVRHTSYASQTLLCATCGKCFPTMQHLDRHDKFQHKKDRPFLCFDCRKKFTTKASLTRHFRRTHAVGIIGSSWWLH